MAGGVGVGEGRGGGESDLHAPQKQFVPLFFRFHFFAGKAPQACQNTTGYCNSEHQNEASGGAREGGMGREKPQQGNRKGKTQ